MGAFYTAGPQALISSAQDFTAAWADLGAEIELKGARWVSLWLNVDINDTLNPQIRLLAKHTSAGTDEYSLPIATVGASDIKVEVEYIELNVDADQKVTLSWEIARSLPYVQFQIKAGTAGATAGQIDSAYITYGY